MKPVFLILPLTISLCACAHQVVTADAAPCKEGSKDRIGSSVLLGSGVSFYGSQIARDIHGIGKFDTDQMPASDCSRAQNSKPPRYYDLDKVGDEPAGPGVLIAQAARPSCPNARRA